MNNITPKTTIKIVKHPAEIDILDMNCLIRENDLYKYMFALSTTPPKSVDNKLLTIRYNGETLLNQQCVFSDQRFSYWKGKLPDGKYQEPKDCDCKYFNWSIANKSKTCDNCLKGSPSITMCEHSNIIQGITTYTT